MIYSASQSPSAEVSAQPSGRFVSTTRRAPAARRRARTTPRSRARLAFARGEQCKTLSVAFLDDAVDEGEETFTLRVSKAVNARIVVGTATGTIGIVKSPEPWYFRTRIGLFLIE